MIDQLELKDSAGFSGRGGCLQSGITSNFDLEISAARVGVIRLLTGTPNN